MSGVAIGLFAIPVYSELMQYLSSSDPKNLSILLRLDLDLPLEKGKFDTTRLEDSFETFSYLWRHKAAHVTVIAHRGHDVKVTPAFSLTPIAQLLYKKLLVLKPFQKTSLMN